MSYIKECLNSKKISSSDIVLGVFFAVAAAIVPLVSRLSIVPVSDYELGTIRVSSTVSDIFSYNKAVLIMVMGVLILLFMVFQQLSGDGFKIDFKNPVCIAVLVFLALALISAIASPYKSIAFKGISERYEGFWVIACYVIFFIVAMNYCKSRYRYYMVIAALCLSALLVGLVGFFQAFGLNFFDTDIAAKLVLGENYTGNKLSIKFDSVFATLYNPNCAGMYFGMMFSFTSVAAFAMPVKNKFKYVFGVLAVITLVCVVGSDSAGGFLGVIFGVGIAALTAVVYLAVKIGGAKIYAVCAAVVVVLAAGAGILFNTDNMIAEKFEVIADALKNGMPSESPNYFKDFYIEDGNGVIVTEGGNVTVLFDGADSQLMLNGSIEDPQSDTAIEGEDNARERVYSLIDNVTWTVDAYEDIVMVTPADADGNEISFIFTVDGGELVLGDKFGQPVTSEAKRIGFEGLERLGSNRGYIWSRSLPLLAQKLCIGKGPDCFVFDFPQYDVRAKLQYLANPYVIVDKPHNMYLQTGINTGVLSLIVMLGIFVFYIVQTIAVLFKSKSDGTLTALRLAVMAGTAAYMAAGLTTDSVVSAAPVFWIMLGAGFGINMIKTEETAE